MDILAGTDMPEKPISGLAELAIIHLSKDPKFHKRPLDCNLIAYKSHPNTLEALPDKLLTLLKCSASVGIKSVNIALSGCANGFSLPREKLEDLIFSNDIVILYQETPSEYKRKQGLATIEIYPQGNNWRRFEQERIKGHEIITKAILDKFDEEGIEYTKQMILGAPLISIRWIPAAFREEDYDIDSVIEALKLGVPYHDVFC